MKEIALIEIEDKKRSYEKLAEECGTKLKADKNNRVHWYIYNNNEYNMEQEIEDLKEFYDEVIVVGKIKDKTSLW